MARDFGIDYCQAEELTCREFPDWPSDRDIAGVGIIVAFCVTAAIVLLAIITGYFADAIRDLDGDEGNGLLNDLDRRLIRTVQRCSRRLLGLRLAASTNDLTVKHNRRDALERFVLALSDQQICTGLALCCLGYAKHCTLSTYHFLVIVVLAWFSSTTHLSTLSLLKRYLNKNPALKYARMAGMFVLYVMLVIGLVVMYADAPVSVSAQCRLKQHSFSMRLSPRWVVAMLLFILLSLAYLSKFVKLCLRGTTGKMQVSAARRAHCQRRIDSLHSRNGRWGHIMFTRVQKTLLLFSYVYLDFLDSFLWQMTWLFFENFYGIRQLTWARVKVPQSLVIVGDDESALNFGQALALCLLILPVIPAVEAFYDIRTVEICRATEEPRLTSEESPPITPSDMSLPSLRMTSTTPLTAAPRSQDDNLAKDSDLPKHTMDDSLPHGYVPLAIGLFMYTITTFSFLAWFCGYAIPEHPFGVGWSLSLAGILAFAGLACYVDDLRRPQGWRANTWLRVCAPLVRWM